MLNTTAGEKKEPDSNDFLLMRHRWREAVSTDLLRWERGFTITEKAGIEEIII